MISTEPFELREAVRGDGKESNSVSFNFFHILINTQASCVAHFVSIVALKTG